MQKRSFEERLAAIDQKIAKADENIKNAEVKKASLILKKENMIKAHETQKKTPEEREKEKMQLRELQKFIKAKIDPKDIEAFKAYLTNNEEIFKNFQSKTETPSA